MHLGLLYADPPVRVGMPLVLLINLTYSTNEVEIPDSMIAHKHARIQGFQNGGRTSPDGGSGVLPQKILKI